MTLQDILRGKGTLIHSISPAASLDDVVQKLVKHNCGSLLVRDDADGRMVGIISERDIMRACAANRSCTLESLLVRDHMTKDVITGAPSDSVEHIMGLMTINRVRHLPVVDGGELKGIISIGDVVKQQHDELTMENHYLKTYITGETDEVMTSSWRPR